MHASPSLRGDLRSPIAYLLPASAAACVRRALHVRGDPFPDLCAVLVAGFRTGRGNLIRDLERAIPPMNAEK